MGWTVGQTHAPTRESGGHPVECPMVPCMNERDRWTSHGMSHNPMGPWDGMDILRHFWTALIQSNTTHNCKMYISVCSRISKLAERKASRKSHNEILTHQTESP